MFFVAMLCRMFLVCRLLLSFFFFFNDTATTEIYTLSLHDALPILRDRGAEIVADDRLRRAMAEREQHADRIAQDRKSTRLNSSHLVISYAVFCLKKKKQKNRTGENKRKTKQRKKRK